MAPAPVFPDLRRLPRRAVDALRGRVGFVVGGIPCQGNSLAGKRRLEADERNLWPDFWGLVRDVGAWGLVIKNVAGILVPDRASGARAPIVGILGDLAEAGWAAEWTTLPARAVGASHKRERLFLVAVDPMRGRGELRAAPCGDGLAQRDSGGVDDAERGAENVHAGRRRSGDGADGPVGAGAGVADSSGAERWPDGSPNRGWEGRNRAAYRASGGGVEHAERAGARTREPGGEGGAGIGRNGSPDRGAGMADPERCGPQDKRGLSAQRREPDAGRRRLPLFAPGPTDGFWLTVLHERPDLLPALVGGADADLDRVRDAGCLPAGREPEAQSELRRLADGVGARMDRLRAGGNGVVPLQAAVAISDCLLRLRGGC